jgi:hypothetical protein
LFWEAKNTHVDGPQRVAVFVFRKPSALGAKRNQCRDRQHFMKIKSVVLSIFLHFRIHSERDVLPKDCSRLIVSQMKTFVPETSEASSVDRSSLVRAR